MKKEQVQEAYQRFYHSIPLESRWELARCSHANEIIDVARKFNYPLSPEECIGIYKMLSFPEHFYKLPPDAIV